MKTNYDVCIIGSGPAGLFAADKLSKEGYRVGILERKNYCSGGLLNDGKLNLDTQIGMDLDVLKLNQDEATKYIDYVDKMLLKFGMNPTLYGMNEEINDYWIKKSKKYNLELKAVKQRHIGTDNAKKLVREFREYLKNNGAVFHLKTNVDEIKHVVSKDGDFELETDKGIFSSKYLIVSPGRHGSMWFKKQSDKLGIESKFNPVDIGLRIEMPLLVYGDITKDIYDPKFIYTNRENGDKVRTFCTNAGGSVRLEPSKELNEKNIINGDAKANEKTDKVNMAILHTVSLTDPIVDTMEFGKRMAEHALWLGGGKPICQRVGDFMNNRRSKVETFSSNGIYNRLKSSLKIPKHAYPGDINHVYSYRTMKNIKQFLKTMDSVFPGFLGSENILYAPEIKFYSYDYPTNDNLETAIENLFVAGDGCGKSRGIVGAGLSGILAAEGIIKKK